MSEWRGILKIPEIKLVRSGEVVWKQENLRNLLHSGGEEMILKTLFYNDGTMPPAYYYLGLDARGSINYSDTMNDLVNEPSGSGYQRQSLQSSSVGSAGFSITTGTLLHKAVSNIVSFGATGTYGPVYNLFLTDASDNSGNLISSVALSSPVTVYSGDTLSLRMTLSLKDCP